MAGAVIPYTRGTMELGGTVLQRWPGGTMKVTTPKTDVKVFAEGGLIDGFITGPTKCTFGVENSTVVTGTEEDYLAYAMDGEVMTFKFTIGGKILSAQGYLTGVWFHEAGDHPECNFEASCVAPSWE